MPTLKRVLQYFVKYSYNIFLITQYYLLAFFASLYSWVSNLQIKKCCEEGRNVNLRLYEKEENWRRNSKFQSFLHKICTAKILHTYYFCFRARKCTSDMPKEWSEPPVFRKERRVLPHKKFHFYHKVFWKDLPPMHLA